MRTTLLEQDRFRKLKWLPSSVPFTCARVREFDQSDQSLYKEHTVYMMYTVYMMHTELCTDIYGNLPQVYKILVFFLANPEIY